MTISTLDDLEEAERFVWKGTEYVVTSVERTRGFFEFVEYTDDLENNPDTSRKVERRLSESELDIIQPA